MHTLERQLLSMTNKNQLQKVPRLRVRSVIIHVRDIQTGPVIAEQ